MRGDRGGNGVVFLVSWRSCGRGLVSRPTLNMDGNTRDRAPNLISKKSLSNR